MVNIITDLAKYVMIILLAVFTLLGFRLVRGPEEKKTRRSLGTGFSTVCAAFHRERSVVPEYGE